MILSSFVFSFNKELRKMPKKQSSSNVSTIAAKVLAGKEPTKTEAKKLAASVLSQDETKGQKPKK